MLSKVWEVITYLAVGVREWISNLFPFHNGCKHLSMLGFNFSKKKKAPVDRWWIATNDIDQFHRKIQLRMFCVYLKLGADLI